MMMPVFPKLFTDFYKSEKAGGFILIGCTIISILIANSSFGEQYSYLWRHSIGFTSKEIQLNYPIEYWINDGLMAIFFLLVGLEIKRELFMGELASLKKASLPLFAALGGMFVPALIHFLINKGTATEYGFGIPMATDIAFALGMLSLLGNRVPASLKIFLTAFAIIDDLGAIVVIAVFYTQAFSLLYFGAAMAIFFLLLVLNRLNYYNLIYYLIPGALMWYFMSKSGIHATISGVLLAFSVPLSDGGENSPLCVLENSLHKPVAFIILPLFALANTNIGFSANWLQHLLSKNSMGILLGLILGKPIGILLFTYTSVKLKISRLADDVNWNHIVGAGLFGGIGFTMSIFFSLLAFDDSNTIVESKIAVLMSSTVAGLAGYIYLKVRTKKGDGE